MSECNLSRAKRARPPYIGIPTYSKPPCSGTPTVRNLSRAKRARPPYIGIPPYSKPPCWGTPTVRVLCADHNIEVLPDSNEQIDAFSAKMSPSFFFFFLIRTWYVESLQQQQKWYSVRMMPEIELATLQRSEDEFRRRFRSH